MPKTKPKVQNKPNAKSKPKTQSQKRVKTVTPNINQLNKLFLLLIVFLSVAALLFSFVQITAKPKSKPPQMYPSALGGHDENYNSYEQRIGVPEGEDPGTIKQDHTRNKDK